ncbi:MAG: hypothetical protein HY457_03325 [Parcubacteria group bacterium]|nr:hypothetical protein [Parcubacteria group bacterium]
MADQVRRLVAEFFVGGLTWNAMWERNLELTAQLVSMGDQIVTPVLDELFGRHEQDELAHENFGSAFFHLLSAIRHFAKPEHAARIAQMLEWEEFAVGQDRSERSTIVKMLEKIGTAATVPALEGFGKRVESIPYTDLHCSITRYGSDFKGATTEVIPAALLHEMDRHMVADALKACQSRT